MALKAYIDGSGTGAPDPLVLAGYVAPAETWAAFSEEWQARLDMNPKLEYLKMNEMAQKPERRERTIWFYRVIEDFVSASVSCVVHTEALKRVLAETRLWQAIPESDRGSLDNPYYFAFAAIISMMSRHSKEIGLSEPVDFIFDNESEKVQALAAWEHMKRQSLPSIRKLLGETPMYRDDRTTLPLQAADLLAWWIRKWTLEDEPRDVRRFPWNTTRAIFGIEAYFDEAAIRGFVADWLIWMKVGARLGWYDAQRRQLR
jgi:hypothetical protein